MHRYRVDRMLGGGYLSSLLYDTYCPAYSYSLMLTSIRIFEQKIQKSTTPYLWFLQQNVVSMRTLVLKMRFLRTECAMFPDSNVPRYHRLAVGLGPYAIEAFDKNAERRICCDDPERAAVQATRKERRAEDLDQSPTGERGAECEHVGCTG